MSAEGEGDESEGEGLELDEANPEVPQVPVTTPMSGTGKVQMKTTQEDRRRVPQDQAEGSSRGKTSKPAQIQPGKETPNPTAGCEQHPDPMVNLVYAVGQARERYSLMQVVVKEMCTRLGVHTAEEVIPALERRPTPAQVESMEKKISELTMENSRLRKTVGLKDEELQRSRVKLDEVNRDIVRMCDMTRIPAVETRNSQLYEAGILDSQVFKGDTFKRFILATMKYTKRIEDNNKEVIAILNRLEDRLAEAGPSSNPPSDPVKVAGSPKVAQATTPTPTPGDAKGKQVIAEASTPPKMPAGPPAGRTRSAVRHLDAEGWVKSPSSQKLHDQAGVETSEQEEAVSTDSNPGSGSEDEYDDDLQITGERKRRGGRIAATPLKKLREVGFERVP